MKKSFVLLAAALFAGANAASTSTAAYAQRWLAAHPAPQGDELAELKDVNPTAYALVKALLTKRSLGLLDPKHPTASFAPAAPKADEGSAAPSGAAAFAMSAEDEAVAAKKQGADSSDAAAVYPEAVPVHAHHDWMSWKPSDSAMDDEAMVNSVLGEVGNLVGKKAAPAAQQDSGSPLSKDEAAFTADFPSAVPAAKPAPAAVEAPAAAAAPQGNSYLRGMNLAADDSAPAKPAAVTAPASAGGLASFSWSDDSQAPVPAATTEAPAATQAPKKKSKTALSAFDSWLNGASPHAKAASQPVQDAAAATTTQNPYTAGLW